MELEINFDWLKPFARFVWYFLVVIGAISWCMLAGWYGLENAKTPLIVLGCVTFVALLLGFMHDVFNEYEKRKE